MMRSIATSKKMPTPTETVNIKSIFGTSDTWLARICRSGSEIVTSTPITKLIKAMSQVFPDFTRYAPTFAPMVCIDISAPIVNMESPNTRHATPNKNNKKVPGVIGVSEMASSATISAIGSTD